MRIAKRLIYVWHLLDLWPRTQTVCAASILIECTNRIICATECCVLNIYLSASASPYMNAYISSAIDLMAVNFA